MLPCSCFHHSESPVTFISSRRTEASSHSQSSVGSHWQSGSLLFGGKAVFMWLITCKRIHSATKSSLWFQCIWEWKKCSMTWHSQDEVLKNPFSHWFAFPLCVSRGRHCATTELTNSLLCMTETTSERSTCSVQESCYKYKSFVKTQKHLYQNELQEPKI